MVDRMPTEEGWIYGQKPKEPEAPGDMEGLFEAAGVPDRLTNGQLPFSPEWYAGAKDRQKLRDIEKEKLLGTRAQVRTEWAELLWTDLSTWGERIDFVVNQPEPLGDLQALLARVKHERPDDMGRFNELQEIAAKAEKRQIVVRKELATATENIRGTEAKIREREAQDDLEEKDRIEKKRIADKRRRRAERALKRQEALLRGEDPPPLVDDSEAEGAGEANGSEAATSPKESAAVDLLRRSPDASPQGSPGPRPRSGRSMISGDLDASPATSVSPGPPLQRGGMSRELPPLQDPPKPPID
eukprot:gb/GFBE01058178.1/.p1 GENE.gb/GFBE01058178.1/~~gb/GFBE01058178.1/.p1  ORF type:complete len:300 (+),score=53.88 gb/GFBE01058178.1/:1-900(+)